MRALSASLALLGVVNDKIAAETDAADFSAQDADAGSMEGGNQRRFDPAEQFIHPLAHLAGSLVGKGHCQYLPGSDAVLVYQPGNAVNDDARLAGTGPGKHQQRSFAMLDCLLLGLIELFEKVHELSRKKYLPGNY